LSEVKALHHLRHVTDVVAVVEHGVQVELDRTGTLAPPPDAAG
jgi:hypothetical protein